MNKLQSLFSQCFFLGHDRNGCKCIRCGKVRDTKHSFNGCVCITCGSVKSESDPSHIWDGCKCKKCGIIRNNEHEFETQYLIECSTGQYGKRGGGQHNDECYGRDCSECETEYRVCKICGFKERK